MIAQGSSVQETEAAAISNWNTLLTSKASDFQSANSDAQTWVYDTQVPFNTAIDDPTAYGAPNATCYSSDGVSCLWWNDYHPGQAIHKLVATGIANTLSGIFF
jgi:phospholipase/lecithinase/hemolysin